jgi:hypothetical protein
MLQLAAEQADAPVSPLTVNGKIRLSMEPQTVAAAEVTPLTTAEKIRLGQLERQIEKNLTGFIIAGRCLLEIRESRLFREQFATFGEYARARFGLCRSTADQLCRSTQVFETLALTTGAPDSATPIVETIPEIVLRPLTTLPDKALQAQTWRLAASVSPDKKPTRTIAAKVTRMVKDAIKGAKREKTTTKEKDVMFVRPIGQIVSLRPDVEPACAPLKHR